jgi:hypothetical protein
VKKTVICLTVLVLMFSLTLTFIPPAHSQINFKTDIDPNIVVTNYSWYIASDGTLKIVGLVQNQGNNTIDPVYLRGSVYSINGEELGDTATQVLVRYLLPQQKAPFIMQFGPPGVQLSWNPSDPAHIRFTGIGKETTGHQYADLTIQNMHTSIGTTAATGGLYAVNGTIKNVGTQTAQSISIAGAFFNKTGSVVAVGLINSYLVDSLAPQKTVDFGILAFDKDQNQVPEESKIYNYYLLVQAGGPILEGTPLATAGPTSSSTSGSSTPSTDSNSPLNLTVVAVIAVVIIAVVVVAAATKLIKPKPKPQKAIKAKVKQRKKAAT